MDRDDRVTLISQWVWRNRMKTRYAPVFEDTSAEVRDLCSGSRILRNSGAIHLRRALP